MKRVLLMLLMVAASKAYSIQVLWVGVSENARVHVGSSQYGVSAWASSIGQDFGNLGARITVGGEPLQAGFADPNELENPSLIPAGQSGPSIIWEFEGESLYEFYVAMVDEYGEPNGMYADWQPINLGDENAVEKSAKIFFELGYFADDGEGDFVPMAYASDTIEDIWNAHTYTSGTLAPPDESPWRPLDFYADGITPEPSAIALLAIGVCMILKTRRAS